MVETIHTTCDLCSGTGTVRWIPTNQRTLCPIGPDNDQFDQHAETESECPACGGSGREPR